jgi:hypothetical protein
MTDQPRRFSIFKTQRGIPYYNEINTQAAHGIDINAVKNKYYIDT